jgi:hypothetical protein
MIRDPDDEAENCTATSGASSAEEGASRLFDEVSSQLAEAREQLYEFVSIKVARLKLSLLQKAVVLATAVLGVVLAAAFVSVSVYLLLAGAAQGLGSLFERPWLGSLLVGVLGIAVIAAVLWITKKRMARKAVSKLEGRRDEST